MLAIGAAIAGVIAIIYFATRPSADASQLAAATGTGEGGATQPSEASRVTLGVGTGLAGIAAAVADAAS